MTAIMPNSSISGGINNGHNTIMIYNAVGGGLSNNNDNDSNDNDNNNNDDDDDNDDNDDN